MTDKMIEQVRYGTFTPSQILGCISLGEQAKCALEFVAHLDRHYHKTMQGTSEDYRQMSSHFEPWNCDCADHQRWQ
jgi:hypothetical protein